MFESICQSLRYELMEDLIALSRRRGCSVEDAIADAVKEGLAQMERRRNEWDSSLTAFDEDCI